MALRMEELHQVAEKEPPPRPLSAQSVEEVPHTTGPYGRPKVSLIHLEGCGRLPQVQRRASGEGAHEPIGKWAGHRLAVSHQVASRKPG